MAKDPLILIDHILESIELIEEYTKGISKKEFLSSFQRKDAVVKRIEIIGEAARNLPTQLKRKYPNIPWKKISGMRDVLIHEYFQIDYELTWDTVKKDLPVFRKQLLDLKEDFEKNKKLVEN